MNRELLSPRSEGCGEYCPDYIEFEKKRRRGTLRKYLGFPPDCMDPSCQLFLRACTPFLGAHQNGRFLLMLVHNLFRLCMIVRRKTPTNFFYLYVPCTSDRSRLIQIGWLTYNNVQNSKPVSSPKNRFSTVSYVFARSPGLGRCRSTFGFDPGFSVIAVSALMNPEHLWLAGEIGLEFQSFRRLPSRS